MPKITVVCASPSDLNPGMLSVDLGFAAMARRNHIEGDIQYACLETPPAKAAADTGIPTRYGCYRDKLDALYASDLIVFWGDFLQCRAYHEIDLAGRLLAAKTVKDKAAADALVQRHLLLTEAPAAVLDKTLMFGGTLYINNAADYACENYGPALAKFVGGIRRAWMRDIVSASHIGHLRGRYDLSRLGVDAALLLRAEDLDLLDPAPKMDSKDRTMAGIHFGRAQADHGAMLEFSALTAASLGLQPLWVPWRNLGADHAGKIAKAWKSLEMPERPKALSALYEIIGRCRVLITDTYHLSIIAWSLGIPTICIGAGAIHPRRSVDDKKKEIFHYTYGAQPYYVFAEQLADKERRKELAKGLASNLAKRPVTDLVTRNIRQHRDQVEEQFARECKRLLGQ